MRHLTVKGKLEEWRESTGDRRSSTLNARKVAPPTVQELPGQAGWTAGPL